MQMPHFHDNADSSERRSSMFTTERKHEPSVHQGSSLGKQRLKELFISFSPNWVLLHQVKRFINVFFHSTYLNNFCFLLLNVKIVCFYPFSGSLDIFTLLDDRHAWELQVKCLNNAVICATTPRTSSGSTKFITVVMKVCKISLIIYISGSIWPKTSSDFHKS